MNTAQDENVQWRSLVLAVSHISEACDLVCYVTTLFQVKRENIRR
jgi:hypothetical protein